MSLPPDTRHDPRPAALAGTLCTLIGTLVLIGWGADIEVFKRLAAGHIVMIPNTAVGFILIGFSLLLQHSAGLHIAARIAGKIAAVAVLALGFATFLERIFEWDFGIDLLLFADEVRSYPYLPPGRMATNSAVSFTLAGIALLLLDYETERGRHPAQILALTGVAVASLALVGYLYGAQPLYAIDRAAGMALLTALTFFIAQSGILFARPKRGGVAVLTGSDAGGYFARRLLPATVLVPLILGWLWIQARHARAFGLEGGVAAFVVVVSAILVAFVLHSAWAVRIADRARQAVLEQEAAARREAVQARQVADAASRAKSDFLATMSHELRTPLNAIIGYNSLLMDGVPEPVTERQRQQLGRVSAAARHLLMLIDEVLTLSRLDVGKESVSITPIRVRDALDEAAVMIEPLARDKGLRFDVEPPADEIAIETDVGKLRQALVNLLTNALKFTDEGSVVLSARPDGDAVCFEVRDSGIGIAPEHLDRIFDSFWQVKQSTTRIVGGAGLGLSVTRRIAEALGGDVRVDSVLGKGSVFTLRLPRQWNGRGRDVVESAATNIE
ncbi:MAG TPA: HAMP domain-containing sensor histidine kinase [Gemmatimonadaceae bacterium]|nr:HAMP domain-containing sensor histidine kinase [Gemmatimonadaceae bacterium]